jgi:hypothetical protein
MKNHFKKLGLLAIAFLSLTSCSKDENSNQPSESFPSAAELNGLFASAINTRTQTFMINATSGGTITTAQGATVTFSANSLSLNSNPATGNVTVEIIEIYKRGDMLATDKPTNAKLPNGDLDILVSGGEIYVNAKQNGQQLQTTGFSIAMPTALTGGTDNGMLFFQGSQQSNGFVWQQAQRDLGFGTLAAPAYSMFAGQFGWINADKFYSDPRPKTSINVYVPSGYNNVNSKVFLSINLQQKSMLNLFGDNVTQSFTYNNNPVFPIGQACHVIFISESNGQWIYAIKPITIAANGSYTFTAGELGNTSEANLVQLINALP